MVGITEAGEEIQLAGAEIPEIKIENCYALYTRALRAIMKNLEQKKDTYYLFEGIFILGHEMAVIAYQAFKPKS